MEWKKEWTFKNFVESCKSSAWLIWSGEYYSKLHFYGGQCKICQNLFASSCNDVNLLLTKINILHARLTTFASYKSRDVAQPMMRKAKHTILWCRLDHTQHIGWNFQCTVWIVHLSFKCQKYWNDFDKLGLRAKKWSCLRSVRSKFLKKSI